jgi:SAM-dependent methyltransferase
VPQDLDAFVGWLKSRQRRLDISDPELMDLFWRVHPRLRFLKSAPWGVNLIDIGAGNGGLAHWRHWGKPDRPDIALYGVDLSIGEHAGLYAGWEAINLDRQLPEFPGVKLDGFFASHLLEYLGAPEALIEWIGRRAEPGARVYLEWTNPISLDLPTREQLQKYEIEVVTSNFIDDWAHKQAPDLARLSGWLNAAGFELISSGAIDLGILGEELFARGADRDSRTMGYWSMTRSSLYAIAVKAGDAATATQETAATTRTSRASADPAPPPAAKAAASEDLTLLRAKRALLVSGLFDAEFYRATYRDMQASTADPLTHYITNGEAEGRSPNSVFFPRYYRRQFMAGAPAMQNALAHYAEEGERLGHKPHPAFDPPAYLAANPLLAEFVDRPLFHYLHIGRAAGLPVAPGPRGEALRRILEAQQHADDFEYSGRANLYELMLYKQVLVRELGVQGGFAFYREVFGFPNSDRIEWKRLTSLYEFVKEHGAAFHEIAPAGESFVVPPPRVIGEGNHQVLQGVTRSSFVACLTGARVRARSSLIEIEELALLDYQGGELDRLDNVFEFDPAVFHGEDAVIWMMGPEDESGTIEIEEAFSLVGPHTASFGHWMCDYLPKYVAAVCSGTLPPVPVLIDESMPETHRQALELMLPDGVEIIALPAFATAHVRRLWFAPSPMYMAILGKLNERSRWEDFTAPPARFAPILGEMVRRLEPVSTHPTGLERIFLARKSFQHRKLTNASVIEAIAKAKGFAVIYPEDLGFAEQVRLIRHARFVVAPNGSASMLAYLARPGTSMCILSHPFTVELMNDVTGILTAVGIDVTVLTGRYINNHPEFPHFADYEVDNDRFEEFLKEWLEKDTPSRPRVPGNRGELKIAAYLGVMDEVELIERTIDHLYSIGVDLIVVGDMGSTDGTLEILKKPRPPERFWLTQPKDQGQELLDAWPTTRLELLRQAIDWVLFIDADEYVLPASGRLKDCAALREADVLYIQPFNVPLGTDGPLMPARLVPDLYEELLLIVKSPADFLEFRRYLQENPDVAWITGVPEPKMMARPECVETLIEGMHDIAAVGREPRHRSKPKDLLIAHVPFTTEARFARKVENARKGLALYDEWGGEYVTGDLAWHWRRWVALADQGRLREEVDRTIWDKQVIAGLRRSGVIRSAAEVFGEQVAPANSVQQQSAGSLAAPNTRSFG